MKVFVYELETTVEKKQKTYTCILKPLFLIQVEILDKKLQEEEVLNKQQKEEINCLTAELLALKNEQVGLGGLLSMSDVHVLS